MFDIRVYFLLFIIYSFLGWLMEVLVNLMLQHKFINRGFLIGPYCPIYGIGCLLITFALNKYTNDIVTLFFLTILLCGSLEYATSFLMEKLFKARWWDYSMKKFNINGRVCLETIIPFGILGMIILYIANPFFITLLQKLPNIALNIISITIAIIYVIDNILSFNIILRFKNISTNIAKDNTEEITEKVKTEIYRIHSKLSNRLLNAFPNLISSFDKARIKFGKEYEELKNNIYIEAANIKENGKKRAQNIMEALKNDKK